MSNRPLPERPNLRHLKDQAKDLLKAGAKSLSQAKFQIARLLRICELAEAQGPRRIIRRGRATQACNRH